MNRLITAAVAALTASACANQAPAAPSAPAPRTQQMPAPTVRLQSPVKVRWIERERTATGALVVAELERLNRVPVLLRARVEVPQGVVVKSGPTEWSVAAEAEAGTVSQALELSFTQPPSGDLVLRVDGDSEGLGFHFQVPYRFGRPAPEVAAPEATGPAFHKGGLSSPTIPLGGGAPAAPK